MRIEPVKVTERRIEPLIADATGDAEGDGPLAGTIGANGS